MPKYCNTSRVHWQAHFALIHKYVIAKSPLAWNACLQNLVFRRYRCNVVSTWYPSCAKCGHSPAFVRHRRTWRHSYVFPVFTHMLEFSSGENKGRLSQGPNLRPDGKKKVPAPFGAGIHNCYSFTPSGHPCVGCRAGIRAQNRWRAQGPR